MNAKRMRELQRDVQMSKSNYGEIINGIKNAIYQDPSISVYYYYASISHQVIDILVEDGFKINFKADRDGDYYIISW